MEIHLNHYVISRLYKCFKRLSKKGTWVEIKKYGIRYNSQFLSSVDLAIGGGGSGGGDANLWYSPWSC